MALGSRSARYGLLGRGARGHVGLVLDLVLIGRRHISRALDQRVDVFKIKLDERCRRGLGHRRLLDVDVERP